MTRERRVSDDSLDLREVGAALWRGRAWFAGVLVACTLLGVVTTSFVRPRYEATASLLLRAEDGASRIALGRLPFDIGSVLGGGGVLDTEIEVLTSQSLIGEVVDSLLLHVDVVQPRATAATDLLMEARFPAARKPLTLVVTREGALYRVRGGGQDARLQPGIAAQVGGGVLTLRPETLPEAFTLRVTSRQEAVRKTQRRLKSQRMGNEVARLTFRAGDPATAAAGMNLLVDRYMERRRTTDRGVNQHRYEFLSVQADSLAGALAQAEARLREFQEGSGVLSPALSAEVDLNRAMEIRAEVEKLEVEVRALGPLAAGRIPSAREIASFPTLLSNPAVGSIHSRLIDLQAQRTELLDRRMEADPDVILLAERIRETEEELVTVARAYVEGLQRKRRELEPELRRYTATLTALPAKSERILALEREVKRLSETLVLLQGQLVQTRVAAIGEGGTVRAIDRAVAPLSPAFPIPVVNVGLGVFGGLFFGLLAAFVAGRTRPWVAEPWEAELEGGAPAVRLQPGGPLLLGLMERSRTILVLPVGRAARPRAVAERLAATGALQGHRMVLADLSGDQHDTMKLPAGTGGAVSAVQVSGHGPVAPGSSRQEDAFSAWSPDGDKAPLALRGAVADLRDQFDVTIVVLSGLQSPVTVALLGADRPVVLAVAAGAVSRTDLDEAAGTLAQQGIPVAAVVLHDQDGRARRG